MTAFLPASAKLFMPVAGPTAPQLKRRAPEAPATQAEPSKRPRLAAPAPLPALPPGLLYKTRVGQFVQAHGCTMSHHETQGTLAGLHELLSCVLPPMVRDPSRADAIVAAVRAAARP